MSSVATKAVTVVPLGRMGFMASYDVQMRYVRNHLDELAGNAHVQGENMLLLVEHTPVYTVGTRQATYSQDYEKTLKQTGAEFYRTNRGGLITYHGPGQLVAYPILNLKQFKPSMKWYVNRLEETLIGTLRRFGISGRRTDQTGVWVDDRKIASIGLHGRRFITSHGVALNVDPNLTWFSNIEACGLPGVDVTSIARELDRPMVYSDAIKPFLRTFQEVFDCDLEYQMLEEKDINSVIVPNVNHSHSKVDHQPADLKEVGVRHMSTQAGLNRLQGSSCTHRLSSSVDPAEVEGSKGWVAGDGTSMAGRRNAAEIETASSLADKSRLLSETNWQIEEEETGINARSKRIMMW